MSPVPRLVPGLQMKPWTGTVDSPKTVNCFIMLTHSLAIPSRLRNRSVRCLRAIVAIGLVSWNTSEVDADTVTATWNKNSESNIAGYILSYGTQSGTYSTSINVGNVITKQVNLSPGYRYYFVVQAYNTSSQVSPRSAEVFADIGVATSAPRITSLTPTSGSVGTSVTIAGVNFGATKGTSTVKFNGITATPTTWSATRLVVQVPPGASTGNVVVTVGGRTSNATVFTVVTLPALWTARGIGNPALAGSASWTSGNFSLKGAGVNIGGTSDQFQFLYQTLDGDGEIVARVTSLQNTHALAKAGLMIREDLTGGARNAFVLVSAGNGLTFQRRVTPNGPTSSGAVFSGAAPYWVRLVRRGNTFRGYYKSTTGIPWIAMGSAVVSMNSRTYVGLAVTSHVPSITATGTFTNVTITRTPVTMSVSLVVPESTGGVVGTSASISGIDSRTQAGTTLSGPHEARSDYDGDGKADVTVFDPSTGKWSILKSSTDAALAIKLGASGDLPVPGDYDGDGMTDIAAYRPATGEWSILLSSTELCHPRLGVAGLQHRHSRTG